MNNFNQGLLLGSIISGSFTYIFTRMYIEKHYFLIPNKKYSLIEMYRKLYGKSSD